MVFFLPLGLFLIWRFMRWDIWIKAAITATGLVPVIVIVVVATAGGGGDDPSEAVMEPSPSPSPSASPSPTVVIATPTATAENGNTEAPDGDVGEIYLEIAMYDNTTDRPLETVEFRVEGYEPWYPDLSFEADLHTMGVFPVGEEHELLIYPDGPDGREIPVVFRMIGDISPSRVVVHISDTSVTVAGIAIPDSAGEFQR